MKSQSKVQSIPGIIHAQYIKKEIIGVEFIFDYGLTFIVSGSIKVILGKETKIFNKGDYIFYRKNFLARFTKQPSEIENFSCITIIFDEKTLRDFYDRNPIKITNTILHQDAVFKFQPTVLLKYYFDGLLPFFDVKIPEELIQIKKQEAIVLLLQTNPNFSEELFGLKQPGKIDLATFMQQNFMFNVDLKRWAYLTGRSLASFKRDFLKTFNMSPNKWIQKRRLEEAYYLIENGNKPIDVFHEVGFTSISHFSFVFKEEFGINASTLYKTKNLLKNEKRNEFF